MEETSRQPNQRVVTRKKDVLQSFLIDLFTNIFANYKHAHIIILFIGFLKYVTSAQIRKLEHLIHVTDFSTAF